MQIQTVIYLFAAMSTVASRNNNVVPDCVTTCWENSRYVTACGDDLFCLCEDTEYQTTVLQCLYSQCHTAQFASALHHTITRCFDYSSHVPDTSPPLIRHQGLRKRVGPDNGQLSARPQGSARPVVALSSIQSGHSVQRRSVSASATGSLVRPSRTNEHITITQTDNGVSATKSGLPTEFDDVGYNESVAPNGSSRRTKLPLRIPLPGTVQGYFVNGTGARTTFDTAYFPTITSQSPSGGQGYNRSLGSATFARSGLSQGSLPKPTGGTSALGFGSYPNLTTVPPIELPSGRPASYNSGGSRISGIFTAAPSVGFLPFYANATSPNNSNGSATGTGSFLTSGIRSNNSVPLQTSYGAP